MRVVSLLPSATETLCALGGRGVLVGRSHECDFPGGLEGVPVLTGQATRYDPQSGYGARAVDEQVRAARDAGRSVYTLDADLLVDLRPDVILTQEVCDVCSIDLESVRAAARAVGERTGREPEIVALNPRTVEDVLDDVLRVGRAVGMESQAKRTVVDLRSRLTHAQEYVNAYAEGPVVGFIEWPDPLYIAGHWTVQLIERSGGRHPLNETVARDRTGAAAGMQQGERVAGRSIAVPIEAFCATRPGVVIVAPCGLNLEQARAEAERLLAHPWFAALPAARAGRVAAVDGSAMFNRPGPRLVEGFEFLVGYLNDRPEVIPEGFPWCPVGVGA